VSQSRWALQRARAARLRELEEQLAAAERSRDYLSRRLDDEQQVNRSMRIVMAYLLKILAQ
jgi:hypothetical protein